MHMFIVPFYSSWLYIVASYYDYTKHKELYAGKLKFHHVENLFWNVFVFQPLSLWYILYVVPPIDNYHSIITEILYILSQIVFGEVWFYTIHYIIHSKYLYTYHKIHHENNEVIGIFALYAHPLDAIITNVGSIFLLHYFIRFSIFHIYLIGTVATINTIISSHTGTTNGFHQNHHRMFNCNYGMNYFMDKLFGTIRNV
jgi:sterol desaturase/sphingolipid hydroxylase (fatty acid hydroxylase superfamily)